jgi:WD40 repeat protein
MFGPPQAHRLHIYFEEDMGGSLAICILSAGGVDEPLRAELEAHLEPLVREGLLCVRVGAPFAPFASEEEIERARVVLLLGSPAFAASRACVEVGSRRALERQTRGEARILLVRLRAHDWTGTPIAELPALPFDGAPIAERADRELAWIEIARSLRAIQTRGYLGILAPRPAPPRERATRRLASGEEEESPFVVPYARSPRFLGREETLAALRALLEIPHTHESRSVSLSGPDGVGKTQLAVEYAYRHRADYPGGIYWVDAAAGMQAGLARLMRRLASASGRAARSIGPRLALQGHLDVVLMQLLQARSPLLIVVDQVADARRGSSDLFFVLHESHVRVLWIPQDAAHGESSLEVPALPEEAAQSLLLESLDGGDPRGAEIAEAGAIVRALGRTPLSITLAAAYLRAHPQTPLAGYRRLLEHAVGHPAEAAIRVQWDAISRETARSALRTAALFARGTEVPRARLALLTDLTAGALEEQEPGSLARAIAELEELALVEAPNEDEIRVPPRVQAFVEGTIADRAAFAEACAERMAVALRDMARLDDATAQRGVDAVLADLRAVVDLGAKRAPAFLPALLRCLDDAAPALQGWKRDEQPERLLQQLCKTASDLGIEDVRGLAEAKLHTARSSYLRGTSHALLPPLRVLRAPADGLRALALTARGEAAVVVPDGGAIEVWDLETGQLQHTFPRAEAPAGDVAVTALQRLAVAASEDGGVRILRLDTGQLLRTFRGHASGVTCVAVTPDARLAVSGASDGGLLAWDLASGEVLQVLAPPTASRSGGPPGAAVDVAVTPDGRFAIAASADHVARVWDLASGVLVHALVHEGRARKVVVSSDGASVFTIADRGAPRIWDIATGLLLRALDGCAGVAALALTPRCGFAVVARADHTLEVWDLKRGRRTRAFEGHGGEVTGLALTPYGRRAVSTSADGTLKVWETGVLEIDRSDEQPRERTETGVTGIAVAADGHVAVSTNMGDGCLKLWDVARGRLVRALDGREGPLGGVVLTPDGRVAVTAATTGVLAVWDLGQGKIVRALRGHEGWVGDVAVTPDARFVVSAGSDSSLKVWDLHGGGDARTLEEETRSYHDVAVTPDGRLGISLGDEAMKVWDLASGRLVRAIDGCRSVRSGLHVIEGGRFALFGVPPGCVVVELTTGAVDRWDRQNHPFAGRSRAAVTADGRFAAVPIGQGGVEVWDLRARRRVAALPSSAPLARCAISADARAIVAADGHGALHFTTWVRPDEQR